MTAVSYGLIGFLMVSGMIFIVEQVSAWLWRPKELPLLTLVLPLKGEIENVEQVVRYYINSMKWQTPAQSWRIFLLDQGIGEETREQCLYLVRGKENIFLVTGAELEQQF